MNINPPIDSDNIGQSNSDGTSVVVVNQSDVQRVIEFLSDLQREDDDVVAQMIPLRTSTTSSTSGTGCVQTTTGSLGTDLKCNDSDQMPI